CDAMAATQIESDVMHRRNAMIGHRQIFYFQMMSGHRAIVFYGLANVSTSLTSVVPQSVFVMVSPPSGVRSILTAVCFCPCHLASIKRSTPSGGNINCTSRATLPSLVSPFQIVLPRCETSNVNGEVVEVRTRCTVDTVAGVRGELGGPFA